MYVFDSDSGGINGSSPVKFVGVKSEHKIFFKLFLHRWAVRIGILEYKSVRESRAFSKKYCGCRIRQSWT